MAPNHGLVHLKEYDIKDSNVELISSDLDHKVKHASAETEPAWNDGRVGLVPGLFVWRIENFTVVPVPEANYGQFYDGDSYIILHSQQIKTKPQDDDGSTPDNKKLTHAIHFWLGAHTSQDEAGTAAYKTVELDSFLHGTATQHRETQLHPSPQFTALFPRLTIRGGGVASGFRHVPDPESTPENENKNQILTLLRIFKHPTSPARDAVIVYEVPPVWRSLDESDVFVLDTGSKIWVWQGKACSPMEKAKAAQVVHEMRLAKRGEVEVLSQSESRAGVVVKILGGGEGEGVLRAERPVVGQVGRECGGEGAARGKRLMRLSDESGELRFGLVKEGAVSKRDLDGDDVFVLDDGGEMIWVWEGLGTSRAEKAMWLRVAQAYVRTLQGQGASSEAYRTPIAKVREGNESAAFLRAIEVA